VFLAQIEKDLGSSSFFQISGVQHTAAHTHDYLSKTNRTPHTSHTVANFLRRCEWAFP